VIVDVQVLGDGGTRSAQRTLVGLRIGNNFRLPPKQLVIRRNKPPA